MLSPQEFFYGGRMQIGMEPCGKCKATGFREVLQTDGKLVSKKCCFCDGEGSIPVFNASPKAPLKVVSPGVNRGLTEAERRHRFLNAPLGDTSWLKPR
jgi:hypothetical protein